MMTNEANGKTSCQIKWTESFFHRTNEMEQFLPIKSCIFFISIETEGERRNVSLDVLHQVLKWIYFVCKSNISRKLFYVPSQNHEIRSIFFSKFSSKKVTFESKEGILTEIRVKRDSTILIKSSMPADVNT